MKVVRRFCVVTRLILTVPPDAFLEGQWGFIDCKSQRRVIFEHSNQLRMQMKFCVRLLRKCSMVRGGTCTDCCCPSFC
jgi:hypothetical protein